MKMLNPPLQTSLWVFVFRGDLVGHFFPNSSHDDNVYNGARERLLRYVAQRSCTVVATKSFYDNFLLVVSGPGL